MKLSKSIYAQFRGKSTLDTLLHIYTFFLFLLVSASDTSARLKGKVRSDRYSSWLLARHSLTLLPVCLTRCWWMTKFRAKDLPLFLGQLVGKRGTALGVRVDRSIWRRLQPWRPALSAKTSMRSWFACHARNPSVGHAGAHCTGKF